MLFLRHTGCPTCQSYVRYISGLDPRTLIAMGIRVILVTHTPWPMLESYKSVLGAVLELYSAPAELYHALGMTLRNHHLGRKGDTNSVGEYNTDGLLKTYIRGFGDAIFKMKRGPLGDLSQV